jgi:hypothetical protein
VKRREFISLVGGTAAAWPLVARAQQPTKVLAIGMLMGYAEDNPETQALLAAFREGLGQFGWIKGRNIRIDYRFAPWGLDQAQLFAKELIALRPDVLVGISTLLVSRSCERREKYRSYLWMYPILSVAQLHQFRAVQNGQVARIAQGDRAPHCTRRSHI